MDIYSDRAILWVSLTNFRRRNGYSLSEFDVDAIIWRLDYSKDGIPQFSKHVSPAEGVMTIHSKDVSLIYTPVRTSTGQSAVRPLFSSFVESIFPVRRLD